MQHPGTDIGFPGLWWDKEEQTKSMNIPSMIMTRVSLGLGCPITPGSLPLRGNHVSCV